MFLLTQKKKLIMSKYDYLCTTFLTYLFIDFILEITNEKFSIQNKLIYVLLATIADVMPMRGINKVLAKNILSKFDVNKNFIFKNISKILEY
jgi:single-stranded-DNA-specific exonuclease